MQDETSGPFAYHVAQMNKIRQFSKNHASLSSFASQAYLAENPESQESVAADSAQSPKDRFILGCLSDLDRKFIVHLFHEGYLSALHDVKNVFGDGKVSTHAEKNMAGGGTAFLVNNRDTLALDEAFEAYLTFSLEEENAAPKMSFERLQVFFHELSHLEYSLTPYVSRFCPTKGKMSRVASVDRERVTAINKWTMMFGSESDVGTNKFMDRFIDEAFADTHAAMLLLRLTKNIDKGALDAIKRIAQSRLNTRTKFEEAIKQDLGKMRLFLGTTGVYAGCSDSVNEALENISDWINLSPQELKQKALEYASNSFLDYIQAPHLFKSMQQVLCSTMIPAERLEVGQICTSIASASARKYNIVSREGIYDIVHEKFPEHPLAQDLVEQTWQASQRGALCVQNWVDLKDQNAKKEWLRETNIIIDHVNHLTGRDYSTDKQKNIIREILSPPHLEQELSPSPLSGSTFNAGSSKNTSPSPAFKNP